MGLTILDYAVIVSYLLAIIIIGIACSGRQKNIKEYFLAGKSMNWIIIALSIFASLFSTISFVTLPGEAYKNGLLYSVSIVGPIICTPIAIYIFIRTFYKMTRFTAYEYLEHRFGRFTRFLGSGVFLIVRWIYTSIVFYAAAKILNGMVGWNIIVVIIVVGTISVICTAMGGVRGVIITEVVQSLVIFFSIGLIALKLLMLLGFDVAGAYAFASDCGKGYEKVLQKEFWAFDLHTRFNVWTLIYLGFAANLYQTGADQLTVQRVLASGSYEKAKKSVWTSVFIGTPLICVLYFIGMAMFSYYHGFNGSFTGEPPSLNADKVMGIFIRDNLPAPIPGLIVAAMLAALMSATNSSVNCLSNVTASDFLLPLGLDPDKAIRYSKIASWIWGLSAVVLSLAIAYASENIESTILEVCGVWMSTTAALLGTFLLAVTRIEVKDWFAGSGLIIGAVANLLTPVVFYYPVPESQRISFIWLSFPGLILAFVIPVLLTLFFGKSNKNQISIADLHEQSAIEIKQNLKL